MGDRGYYEFNQQYILFNIDSALGTHQVDVELVIKGPDENDSTATHRIFKLDNIYIRTDFDPLELEESIPSDTIRELEYHFLYSDLKPKFKSSAKN